MIGIYWWMAVNFARQFYRRFLKPTVYFDSGREKCRFRLGFGSARVTVTTYANRLSICAACPLRFDNTCAPCGCRVRIAAGWRDKDCPTGQWPDVSSPWKPAFSVPWFRWWRQTPEREP